MDSNYSSRPQKLGAGASESQNVRMLVLHNDDINTFEYVMESLVEVCEHSNTQAEQCAMIAHYKGKCDIMKGSLSALRKVRAELADRGLKTTIE